MLGSSMRLRQHQKVIIGNFILFCILLIIFFYYTSSDFGLMAALFYSGIIFPALFLGNIVALKLRAWLMHKPSIKMPSFNNKLIKYNFAFIVAVSLLGIIGSLLESGVGLIFTSMYLALALFVVQYASLLILATKSFMEGMRKNKDTFNTTISYLYTAHLVGWVFFSSVFIHTLSINIALRSRT